MLRRLHIVGCVRSGTSLMMQLTAACFNNDGHCEHEQSIFKPVSITSGLYISKNPHDTKCVSYLIDKDPNLFVIYMERDPRAVITSIHRAEPDRYFADFNVWKISDKTAADFRSHPRFKKISYFELVTAPNDVQQNLLQTFPFLEKKHDFSEYENVANPNKKARVALNDVQAINTKSLEKWKNHLGRIKAQIELHPNLPDVLIRAGFETDKAWLSILDGVEVVERDHKSRYRDSAGFFGRLEQDFRYRRKAKKYLQRAIENGLAAS